MLKKIISIFAVSVTGINLAYADYTVPTIYIAPSLAYEDFYISGTNNYEGITGKLAVGGSVGWDYAYLGAEAFASPKPLNVSSGSSKSSYKPSSIYGFSILPGWNFDGTVLGYARFGVAYANFTSLKAVRRGYQVGGGFEWALYSLLSLRGDAIYTRYNSISGTGSINGLEFAAGVVYRFAC